MKKEYRKPRIVKVDLKVEQTVLADCKTSLQTGPDVLGCQGTAGGDCLLIGS